MIPEVKKRDGRYVQFDKSKIIDAVLKAFKEVDGNILEEAKMIATDIGGYVEGIADEHLLSVENIQDIVEEKLMESNRKDVARAYILYRNERNKARERNSALMKDIKKKVFASDVQNQNANVDEKSFGGRLGESASTTLRQFAKNFLLSEKSLYNHENNMIYIHDFDHYPLGDHNCLTIPFDDLLANGFNTRQTDVRPANSINTAFQLVAVLFQLQSLQQFGGCSASHLDWTMVPYVRKSFRKHFKDGMHYIEQLSYKKETGDAVIDTWRPCEEMSVDAPEYKLFKKPYQYALDMTIKELQQAVEGMYHNLNY